MFVFVWTIMCEQCMTAMEVLKLEASLLVGRAGEGTRTDTGCSWFL